MTGGRNGGALKSLSDMLWVALDGDGIRQPALEVFSRIRALRRNEGVPAMSGLCLKCFVVTPGRLRLGLICLSQTRLVLSIGTGEVRQAFMVACGSSKNQAAEFEKLESAYEYSV